MAKLLIHVPHASTHVPDDVWQEFLISRDAVEREAQISADLYTDEIARQAWPSAEIVEADVSRIIVDVERYDDDSQEEMAQVGRGVLYTCDHQAQKIRDYASDDRREELLDRYYWPHWQRLRALAFGATLIDLHTYPAERWPIEVSSRGERPEIDLGFTEGLTSTRWITSLTHHFQKCGYAVGHNTPYSGVIDAGAMSAVMIEVRRDLVGTPGNDPRWVKLINTLKTIPLE